MQKVMDHFLKPLKPFFDDPKMAKGGTVEEFYTGVAESLVNFSETVLDAAVQKVKEEHKWRTFPQVADCIGYCKAARDELYGKTIANAPPKEPYPEWTKERQSWAAKVLCGSQGLKFSLRAADDGSILALWDFVRGNARLPNEPEFATVQTNHRIREASLKEHGVPIEYRGLRKAMLGRRDKLAELVRREKNLS
jgi:hypothetical protein